MLNRLMQKLTRRRSSGSHCFHINEAVAKPQPQINPEQLAGNIVVSDAKNEQLAKDASHWMGTQQPVIFDIGANEGQTTEAFLEWWPEARIHAFEPSSSTFAKLQAAHGQRSNVRLNRLAMGATLGSQTFAENNQLSVLSSFLRPAAEFEWQRATTSSTVEVKTVDAYCQAHGIDRIDLLKTDTQGFDLEVFKGAERMLRENRVRLIKMELIFTNMYEGQAQYYDLFRHLDERGYVLISLYDIYYRERRLAWLDALLVNQSCPV